MGFTTDQIVHIKQQDLHHGIANVELALLIQHFLQDLVGLYQIDLVFHCFSCGFHGYSDESLLVQGVHAVLESIKLCLQICMGC